MKNLYDVHAPKKATNLSINSDLLQKARSQGLNLSSTLEEALKEIISKQTEEDWLKENARALQANSQFIDEHGCFGSQHKVF